MEVALSCAGMVAEEGAKAQGLATGLSVGRAGGSVLKLSKSPVLLVLFSTLCADQGHPLSLFRCAPKAQRVDVAYLTGVLGPCEGTLAAREIGQKHNGHQDRMVKGDPGLPGTSPCHQRDSAESHHRAP